MASVRPESEIYASLLAQAARSGVLMLQAAFEAARRAMRHNLAGARETLVRDHLDLSLKLLELHAPRMLGGFEALLLAQFRQQGDSTERLSAQSLHLDELELMDDAQVHDRVELARLQQQILLKVEAPLAELNVYVCALLGLSHVVPQRNVLRPDAFVAALQASMAGLLVPLVVRQAWLPPMAISLGESLSHAYLEWSNQLRAQGLAPAKYSVLRSPGVTAQAVSAAATQASAAPADGRADRKVWTPQYRQTVLTLDGLRRLMKGALDSAPVQPMQAFAKQFAHDFESGSHGAGSSTQAPSTGFAATVPAAFEALQDMQQVDEVVERMRQRQSDGADAEPAALLREQLTQQATSMSQVLSLEVVSIMLERLVRDPRLLAPLRRLLERLEPALLRLVLVDPRFFIDRQHPARRLLQEISQRGLAFAHADDPDFRAFHLSLQRHLGPLLVLDIDSQQPFEQALADLLAEWDDPDTLAAIASQIDTASAVLDYAEQRNLLAQEMATRLMTIPDTRRVSDAVLDFLRGPWSQVMAEAALKDRHHTDDPRGYKALVNDLLWSAQPELTRKDVARLTRMVSRLLNTLREGLALIGYPSVKTSAFFDVLMKLHQQAFRPASVEPVLNEPAGLAPSLLGNQDHWVAPAEARASGFMALPDTPPPKPAARAQTVAVSAVAEPEPAPAPALDLGAWFELESKGQMQRLQLSWVSPQGSMVLFTSARGKTQSMSRRLMDRLVSEGGLRLVSNESTSVLDGALDEVVHSALLNSIDLGA